MLNISRQIFLHTIRRGQVLSSSAVLPRNFQQKNMLLHSSDTINDVTRGKHPFEQQYPNVQGVTSGEDISYNLTKHEAVTFLENVLGISDPITFVNKDRGAFLQEMMRQTKMKIPFTNISCFRDGFKNLSLDEIKQALFKQEGGHCFAINTFINAVLQHLEFDTYLIGASAQRWKVPLFNNHTAVIAKHLTTTGSLHLVDVGSQHFLPLVSLDFDRISQVYYIGSFQYRFFQVSPGVVQLTRRCELPQPGRWDGLIYMENDDHWEVLLTFKTSTPRKLAECHYQQGILTENSQLAPAAHEGIWLMCYPENLLVYITDKYCMTITETGNKEVTKMKNSTQVVDTILKYFPQYSRNHLESMADYFAKKIPQQKHVLNSMIVANNMIAENGKSNEG